MGEMFGKGLVPVISGQGDNRCFDRQTMLSFSLSLLTITACLVASLACFFLFFASCIFGLLLWTTHDIYSIDTFWFFFSLT